MSRSLFRTFSTAATTLVLLVLTALPAFAASGTKPDPSKDPYLVGSMDQLVTTAIVAVVVAVIAWILLPSNKGAAAHDDH